MTKLNQNLTVWTGDSRVIALTINDADGDEVNLTGATVRYAIAEAATSGTKLVEKTTSSGISITDAANGKCEITLAPADTTALQPGVPRDLYHECEVEDSTGKKMTAFTGKFRLNPSIYKS